MELLKKGYCRACVKDDIIRIKIGQGIFSHWLDALKLLNIKFLLEKRLTVYQVVINILRYLQKSKKTLQSEKRGRSADQPLPAKRFLIQLFKQECVEHADRSFYTAAGQLGVPEPDSGKVIAATV